MWFVFDVETTPRGEAATNVKLLVGEELDKERQWELAEQQRKPVRMGQETMKFD